RETTVEASKTVQQWQAEIDALTTSIGKLQTEVEAQRARRGSLALDAARGDANAEAELKQVSAAVSELLWQIDTCDLAIVEASRHLQAAEAAEQSARVAAILAE